MNADIKEQTVYVMCNKVTGVQIECTRKFVMDWLARGFEVKEIIVSKSEQGR